VVLPSKELFSPDDEIERKQDMALKAHVDGIEVQSWRCSPDRWKELVIASKKHQIAVTMCCCGTRGILRKGSRRPHFAHYRRPENCNHRDESREHEEAKWIIAQACLEAGCEVNTEVSGPGYIADVLATKDGKEIAFEVQLTYQTLDVTEERRQRYRNDNVRDIWLFKKMPTGCDGRKPRFHILEITGDVYTVKHWEGDLPLDEFAKKALQIENEQAEDLEPYELSDEAGLGLLWLAEWVWKYKYYILGLGALAWLFRRK
jgi:hypothetical protein